MLSMLMKAAGAPDGVVELERAKENLMTEAMMKVFLSGLGGKAANPPKEPS
jgi:hypothetical protein